MAIVRCGECHNLMSTLDANCPHCGAARPSAVERHPGRTGSSGRLSVIRRGDLGPDQVGRLRKHRHGGPDPGGAPFASDSGPTEDGFAPGGLRVVARRPGYVRGIVRRPASGRGPRLADFAQMGGCSRCLPGECGHGRGGHRQRSAYVQQGPDHGDGRRLCRLPGLGSCDDAARRPAVTGREPGGRAARLRGSCAGPKAPGAARTSWAPLTSR